MVANLSWTETETAQHKLVDVYKQMNLDAQCEIPAIVKLFENPVSPIALPGNISLHNHDCLHIVFGLGVSPPEEAFIIGFTMGNDDRTANWHLQLFKFISRFIYPPKYQFTTSDLELFDLGYSYGKKLKVRNLNQLDFAWFYQLNVEDIRKIIGISIKDYIGLLPIVLT